MIDWIEFYAVPAIFQPCKVGLIDYDFSVFNFQRIRTRSETSAERVWTQPRAVPPPKCRDSILMTYHRLYHLTTYPSHIQIPVMSEIQKASSISSQRLSVKCRNGAGLNLKSDSALSVCVWVLVSVCVQVFIWITSRCFIAMLDGAFIIFCPFLDMLCMILLFCC